jgi:hypothetical protein
MIYQEHGHRGIWSMSIAVVERSPDIKQIPHMTTYPVIDSAQNLKIIDTYTFEDEACTLQ